MKKMLVMAACLALIITLSVTGTIAFKAVDGGNGKSWMLRGNSNVSTFAETDNGVSVMNNNSATDVAENTDGLIKQTIWKRNGNSAPESTTGLTIITENEPDKTQLLPAPGSDSLIDNSNNTVKAEQGWTMWTVNGLDRIVTVENTSKTALSTNETTSEGISVYVRTIFAFENPNDIVDELILLNYNTSAGTWKKIDGDVEIGDDTYRLYVYTYNNALQPGDTTQPSLKQVVLKAAATNEDVAKFGEDGFTMYVTSQAVQKDAFGSGKDAAATLKEAFGDITTDSNPWKTTTTTNAKILTAVAN